MTHNPARRAGLIADRIGPWRSGHATPLDGPSRTLRRVTELGVGGQDEAGLQRNARTPERSVTAPNRQAVGREVEDSAGPIAPCHILQSEGVGA